MASMSHPRSAAQASAKKLKNKDFLKLDQKGRNESGQTIYNKPIRVELPKVVLTYSKCKSNFICYSRTVSASVGQKHRNEQCFALIQNCLVLLYRLPNQLWAHLIYHIGLHFCGNFGAPVPPLVHTYCY